MNKQQEFESSSCRFATIVKDFVKQFGQICNPLLYANAHTICIKIFQPLDLLQKIVLTFLKEFRIVWHIHGDSA